VYQKQEARLKSNTPPKDPIVCARVSTVESLGLMVRVQGVVGVRSEVGWWIFARETGVWYGSLETRDRNASKHANRRQIEGGGREMRPAQAAEGRSVGNRGRLLNWEAALLPGWSLSLHSRSVEHRRRAEGRVNAGSKQNDRQHKRSGRQQLER
jgi:hypothetical protein